MVDKQGFDDTEWELLLSVPFAEFFLVAYADGTVSPAEGRAFASIAKEVGEQADRPQDGHGSGSVEGQPPMNSAASKASGRFWVSPVPHEASAPVDEGLHPRWVEPLVVGRVRSGSRCLPWSQR
ncbi:MAG: hypothetical protein WCF36_02790 [Candidatus Nanopelagicales bacterium]